MAQTNIKQTIKMLLAHADVEINGSRPWDLQVHNEKLYQRVLEGGTLALGEAYMDGWWDCEALDKATHKILRAGLGKRLIAELRKNPVFLKNIVWGRLKAKIINMQRKSKAYEIGKRHYDIGNNLFQRMLDKRMNYSCGYWKNAENLDQAQEAKLNLICKKINIRPGMKILDIGGGWGGFVKYAVEKYNVEAVAITVSKEQVKLSKELCRGLPVEIRLQDYRDLKEKFDAIVSVGMIEHVGCKNYRTYMKIVSNCLKKDGLFLLHTIASNTSVHSIGPWINKYIFPNGMLPSAKQITAAAEGLFVLEDWHSFGADYDKTLMAWHKNFNNNWDEIKADYDERFYRMWNYYLLTCAGGFRARQHQLWQIVFSKKGMEEGYQSIR